MPPTAPPAANAATIVRPAQTTPTDASVLWEYEQVSARYRSVSAKNPLGFQIQMQLADEYGHFGKWADVDTLPAIVLGPLFEQRGITPSNGGAALAPTKAQPAAAASRGKVNVKAAATT